MSKLEEESSETHHELIFPCNCSNGDYLRITWDEEDSEWRWLWIEAEHAPTGWDRIRSAWKALRGQPFRAGEIILTDATVDSLRQFLGTISPGEVKADRSVP